MIVISVGTRPGFVVTAALAVVDVDVDGNVDVDDDVARKHVNWASVTRMHLSIILDKMSI